MTKIDPYKHKERYLKWKESAIKDGIPEINKYDSDLILRYIQDMEIGLNVSNASKKGARSHIRLNTIRIKLIFLCKKFQEFYNLDKITNISEMQLHKFFSGMREGKIRRNDGKIYQCTADYVKTFKAFWHWYQKVSKKQGKKVLDITTDLDTSCDKPKWVYLTEKQVKKLCDNTKYKYKVLMMFLFDSGIRSPTELINIKVSDLYDDCKELNIREEVSKTFGRRIKLMLCSELIKEYICDEKLSQEDYLFKISPVAVNQHLKRTAKRVLGDGMSQAGQKYSDLTMYDFRHISCCYWLPRYPSESSLKYRFGWKQSDKIHYYSELLGMRDTIREEDMLIDVTKTEIEKKLSKSENEKQILLERVGILEGHMDKIMGLVRELGLRMNVN